MKALVRYSWVHGEPPRIAVTPQEVTEAQLVEAFRKGCLWFDLPSNNSIAVQMLDLSEISARLLMERK